MKNQMDALARNKPGRFLDFQLKEAMGWIKGFRIKLATNLIGFFLVSTLSFAQESEQKPTPSGLGNGLNFSLNEGDYQFKISGFLQPSWQYAKVDNADAQHTFRSKRSYLNFSGKALKEKVSFFVQTDFSATRPLLDAWIAYHVSEKWKISAGQLRTFTNNREMTFDEDRLQFSERGMLSTSFSGNGREFGLFVEGKIGSSFILHPQVAVTSGDGPNSFGINSTDVDLGGFKYGGRLDVYPLGEFSEGNRGFAADLKHEGSLKLVMGGAASLNRGASSAKGEGHGDFRFYDKNKVSKLPDYRKISADILLKYKGFSLLGEFINASGANLNGIYLDSSAQISQVLKPGQISQFLVLGNAWNLQAGYVTKSGFALDLRYESMEPEFADQAASQLRRAKVSTVGLSKYFPDNRLKVQASLSQVEYTNQLKAIQSELLFQVVF